ncbi:bifunctional protein-serine/threonine kinase/phosphatase [Microbulbifer sp. YPW16]|uniref:bifunctional protein-serine/threonine kinase/phosphatase n=1 Tax=Microbulbifer sp. YPW16 TaxID=2904242 RepID=UPI001E2FAEA8|nr:bifunctional protein-serine/threonine kinase/phosphatase [Microbulbifer sp. YPW16]UHQ56596.1 bifunctional serine/threonine-protein phosphatase/kinase [Microbulbifer sp. YPW16]
MTSASCAGRRVHNDDACAVCAPSGSARLFRGALAAVADGVASAEAGGEAARAAISGFLSDYYSTPETWSVKQAAARVLHALNSWLYRQGGGSRELRQGWLTTFSCVIFKGASAHLIHIGDSRIYRLRGDTLDCLTCDHSRALGRNRTFLARALGMDAHIEVDYRCEQLEQGDIFLVCSDGVHDYLAPARIATILRAQTDDPARALLDAALAAGSEDNLSAAVVRVRVCPEPESEDLLGQRDRLPFPPDLRPGNRLDGFLVLQELHASARSQLYLARDIGSGALRVIKTPSANFIDDPAYIENFIAEEWTGRRLDHPGIVRIYAPPASQQFLYHVMEYVEGQSLRQWLELNPAPPIEQVRELVQQLVSALRRLQRMEIIHGDLKPENIMISADGRLKLVDLGGANAAGLREHLHHRSDRVPGSKNYIAPEYFLGDAASHRSDIFSLGVITYELLTGHYPYRERAGDRLYRLHNYSALHYRPARNHRPELPLWIDRALQRACHPNPRHRYAALSEFVHDLHTPNPEFTHADSAPLMERNPLLFWQLVALLLLLSHLLHFLQ